MKLLLTSAGMTNEKIKEAFVALLGGLENKKCCMIHTIRSEDDWKWLDLFGAEMKEIGLDYDWVNISEQKDHSTFTDYDVFYVLGGNTFYILDRLKKTGMYDVILQAVKAGKVYAGVSAGSIIASKDIEIAGIGESGDENDIALEDLTGFGFVPFHISPHYNEQEKKFVGEFHNKRNEPIITLTDQQAVMVSDEKINLVGEERMFCLPEDYKLII